MSCIAMEPKPFGKNVKINAVLCVLCEWLETTNDGMIHAHSTSYEFESWHEVTQNKTFRPMPHIHNPYNCSFFFFIFSVFFSLRLVENVYVLYSVCESTLDTRIISNFEWFSFVKSLMKFEFCVSWCYLL